jgi:hypothetical protein
MELTMLFKRQVAGFLNGLLNEFETTVRKRLYSYNLVYYYHLGGIIISWYQQNVNPCY